MRAIFQKWLTGAFKKYRGGVGYVRPVERSGVSRSGSCAVAACCGREVWPPLDVSPASLHSFPSANPGQTHSKTLTAGSCGCALTTGASMIIVVTDDELEGVLEELDDFLEDMHECGYSLGAILAALDTTVARHVEEHCRGLH